MAPEQCTGSPGEGLSPELATAAAACGIDLQDGPPWRISRLVSELLAVWAAAAAERDQIRREGYEAGFADGKEAGAVEAEREMDQSWKQLARRIRGDVDRCSFATRRAAELEWTKPRQGDFTGRLTPDEYFGTDAPPTERRAAA